METHSDRVVKRLRNLGICENSTDLVGVDTLESFLNFDDLPN